MNSQERYQTAIDAADEIYRSYGIGEETLKASKKAEELCADIFAELEANARFWELKILKSFQDRGFQAACLGESTGYGNYDMGRETLEEIFAEIMGAEKALLRMQFSSGTHVLVTCLRALLRPGDEVLFAAGEVYDTLHHSLGINRDKKSTVKGERASALTREGDEAALSDFGISSKFVDLDGDFKLDKEAVAAAISEKTALIYVQKSRGYSLRPALKNRDIKEFCDFIHQNYPGLPIMVDNCYGELVEYDYPMMGADIAAGSLIKNSGAGIARTGAYIVGKEKLVDLAAQQFTASGIGGEIGPTLGFNRELALGLFFAPRTILQALKGACHAAALFASAGYEVEPAYNDPRSDIVQIIKLADENKLIKFVEAVQKAAPVDSMFTPVPSEQAGYDCDIIMASGSFTQGSSIELSADGPLREPYAVFMQGALSYTSSKLAAMLAFEKIVKEDEK